MEAETVAETFFFLGWGSIGRQEEIGKVMPNFKFSLGVGGRGQRAGVEAVLHGGFPNPPPVQMEDQRDFYIHSLEIVAFHSHGRSFFIFMHMGIHFILLFFFYWIVKSTLLPASSGLL
uniref:Uncharacterized protein n=1 Tax=Picea sitchensis TaxID=3332 RepID=B8LRK2_PICSI|nr:unknown [Picea sitchensis]